MRVYFRDRLSQQEWGRKASSEFLNKLQEASWRQRLQMVEDLFPGTKCIQHARHGLQVRFPGSGLVVIDFPPYAYAEDMMIKRGWRRTLLTPGLLFCFTAGLY